MPVRRLEAWKFYRSRPDRRATFFKTKYLLIVYTVQSIGYGFLVNSNVSMYHQRNENLRYCDAPLPQGSQNFLQYDSYLECGKLIEVTREDLDREQDWATRANIEVIVEYVMKCPRRSAIEREAIRRSAQEHE